MNTNKNIRISLLLCAFTILCTLNLTYAQVGIGTTTPDASAVLDITSANKDTGVLFPRLTTLERDAISSPAAGLLIYNIDENEFQYNFGTPLLSNWVSVKNSGSQPRSVKYHYDSSASNPNLNNSGGQVVPIFVAPDWNDDTSLYVKTANGFLTINESGRYRFTVNIDMEDTDGDNDLMSLYVLVRVNGVELRSGASTALFANQGSNENVYSSLNFSEIYDITAGDSVSIIAYRDSGAGNVLLSGTGYTNISIEKLE
ncbi:hypothetical protein [Ascidiimonas sp. W6]|uniref:hypothetical protein n=1 Tax=Ascidiimonas meishanensis TaxID=3128903 RepID=UPI0030ECFD36